MTATENPISDLLVVIDRLLAPDGCPWDKEQTVLSLGPMLLEEVCETLDAISERNGVDLSDELGDLFVTALFFAKAAEKEGRFSWDEPFKKGKEKLVRRHPHIFEKAQALSSADVEVLWEETKKKEPSHKHRKGAFSNIPVSLPGLSMMQKLFSVAKKRPALGRVVEECVSHEYADAEEELGMKIASLVLQAEAKGIRAEHAVRKCFALCKKKLQEAE